MVSPELKGSPDQRGAAEMTDLQGQDRVLRKQGSQLPPPHLPASPAAYVSILPMLASSLPVGPLPWVQGSLQRVLRMGCGNGLSVPLSSIPTFMVACWPPKAPWLAMGQILWYHPCS